MSRLDSINAILDADLCCGCGLCESFAGSQVLPMGYNDSGFLRPRPLSEPTTEVEQRILEVCPAVNVSFPENEPHYHETWGPIRVLLLAHAADDALRHRASSGGALSAILGRLIEDGSVDGVCQIGADPELPVGNRSVVSTTLESVRFNSGSRYSPSAPLRRLSELKVEGRRFAIVGKPCDISAATALSRRDGSFRTHFPYMISFFCGGIPSIQGAAEVLRQLGVEQNDVAEFRYRGNGWPGFAEATTHDGTSARMSYNDSWGKILNRHLQLRCKICPDSTGESADIVCADGWHLDPGGKPDFSEHPGRSIVIARSELGEKLLKRCIEAGDLLSSGTSTDELAQMQPYQAKRKQLVLSRLLAMKICGMTTPRFSRTHLLKAALRAGPTANLRSFAGMLVRAWRRQRS